MHKSDKTKKPVWIVFLCLAMVLSFSFSSFASSDKNTDSDTEPIDGYYTFTGNGDWYGYTSYLNVAYGISDEDYVGGREYEVTLPEDGRLAVELKTDKQVFMSIYILEKGDRTLYYDKEWQFGSAEEPINISKKSDMLKAGTYSVLFEYTLTGSDAALYWPPGRHDFYHKLTFVSLNSDEKAAFSVIKAVSALPETGDLTLNNESAVKAAQSGYNALTSSQKTLVSAGTKNRLADCADRIAVLSKEKAAKDAYNKKITAAKAVQVKGLKVKALKKKKAKLSWKKASGVSGYQIQYSRNKNFKTKVKKKTIKSAATLKATVKSLTARKTWYFRIRSYTRIKDSDGNIVTRYGKWSTKVKCKAKK